MTKEHSGVSNGIKQKGLCSICEDLEKFFAPYRNQQVFDTLKRKNIEFRISRYSSNHPEATCRKKSSVGELKKQLLDVLKKAGVNTSASSSQAKASNPTHSSGGGKRLKVVVRRLEKDEKGEKAVSKPVSKPEEEEVGLTNNY